MSQAGISTHFPSNAPFPKAAENGSAARAPQSRSSCGIWAAADATERGCAERSEREKSASPCTNWPALTEHLAFAEKRRAALAKPVAELTAARKNLR